MKARYLFAHNKKATHGLAVIDGTEELIWFENGRAYRLPEEVKTLELYRKTRYEDLLGLEYSYDKPQEERIAVFKTKAYLENREKYYKFNGKRPELRDLILIGPVELYDGG